MKRHTIFLAMLGVGALALAQPAPQQQGGPPPMPWRPLPPAVPEDPSGDAVAIHVNRAITVSGEPIEDATILVRGGKIVSIGKLVDVPHGAKHIEYSDGVAMPGLVMAMARSGFVRPPVAGPASKAKDGIDITSESYRWAARSGITTMAVVPSGQGIPGQASVIRTRAKSIDDATRREESFLVSTFEGGTASKDGMRRAFESAKEEMERFEKAQKEAATPPPPPKEAPASAPAGGTATQPATQPAPPKAPPKLDPRQEPMVKVLKKEKKLLTMFASPIGFGFGGGGSASASDILHFHDAVKQFEYDRIYSTGPGVVLVADKVAAVHASVLLASEMWYEPNTRIRINPAEELRRAGVKFALLPTQESREGFQEWMFKIGELVKYGLPEKEAYRAVTLTPAELLGLGDQIGALAAGHDADIVIFNGNPFDTSTKIRAVMIAGEMIPEDEL
jgi:hypothetical protein